MKWQRNNLNYMINDVNWWNNTVLLFHVFMAGETALYFFDFNELNLVFKSYRHSIYYNNFISSLQSKSYSDERSFAMINETVFTDDFVNFPQTSYVMVKKRIGGKHSFFDLEEKIFIYYCGYVITYEKWSNDTDETMERHHFYCPYECNCIFKYQNHYFIATTKEILNINQTGLRCAAQLQNGRAINNFYSFDYSNTYLTIDEQAQLTVCSNSQEFSFLPDDTNRIFQNVNEDVLKNLYNLVESPKNGSFIGQFINLSISKRNLIRPKIVPSFSFFETENENEEDNEMDDKKRLLNHEVEEMSNEIPKQTLKDIRKTFEGIMKKKNLTKRKILNCNHELNLTLSENKRRRNI
ncbi:hypothetical protein SNEBB_003106 [Seison nebaliae]|nr:hypothetical protein SNEBB_003106 [Seison nebaliae]